MTREIDLADVRTISIDNLGAGAVTVQTADGDRVVGRIESESDYLAEAGVRQVGDHLQIAFPRRRLNAPEVYIDLRVPEGLGYRITAGAADVRILTRAERSTVATGSGDIQLVSVADVSVKSGSGSISIGELHGRSAQLTTGSGDISVEVARAPLQARSASGDVTINELSGELRATSSSGDISVPATTASVDLRSASGSLDVGVADGLLAWLDLSSVSGHVEIGLDADHEPADGEPFVGVRARTASGDISVYRAA